MEVVVQFPELFHTWTFPPSPIPAGEGSSHWWTDDWVRRVLTNVD
jgi:hypothetical protein